MQTPTEVKHFIESRHGLLNLIENSKHVNAEYRPRSGKRSQSKLALDHFWSSVEGMEFREMFEDCLGGELAASLLRGAGAITKSAVFTLIIEHRMRKGLKP